MQTGAATALAALTSTEVAILDGATVTTAELNYVDGVTSSIQTQINGATSDISNLQTLTGIADGNSDLGTFSGSTISDNDSIKDALLVQALEQTAVESASTSLTDLGVTSTAAELNVLDGITATTAELNILDGVTSTAAELNILDGVTSTGVTTELNILDGVTASNILRSTCWMVLPLLRLN